MNDMERNGEQVYIGRPPKAPRPQIARKKPNPMAEMKKTAEGGVYRTQVKVAKPKVQKIETVEKAASKAEPNKKAPAEAVKEAPAKVQPKQNAPVKAPVKTVSKPQSEYERTIPGKVLAAKPVVPTQRIFDPEPITHHNKRMRDKAERERNKEETVKIGGGDKVFSIILKTLAMLLACVLTLAVVLASTALVSIKLICGETSPAAKELFVTTLLETGQMKSLATLFLSPEEVQALVDNNTMEQIDEEIDSSLITIDPAHLEDKEQADIEVVEISGSTFYATMLIIKDPSRISVSTIYPWADKGKPLDEIVTNAGAVAGINGGLYNSSNNSGGHPYGIVVSNGEIQYNEPHQFKGFVLIGFTEDNILEIIPIDGYSKADVEKLVKDKKIRDAVTFQEEASDKNNHFVQLVINGEAREMNGMGSGLNPRTAIGQRADGSVLLLVTDGRGKEGHLGASASDLINIMVEYGAINAANLDGGSSSCMYHNGEYLMDSVTFYEANTSWKLPLAFVVK